MLLRAAIDLYLLPAGPQQQTRRTLLQRTNGQTPYRFTDPTPHTLRAVPITKTVDRKISAQSCVDREAKSKDSPYSIAERKVPELIPVLGSQHTGYVSHKPGGRLSLLSTRTAVTFPARRPVPISLLGEQKHDGCEQFA